MSPKLDKDNTLLLIDSHALIHRAFHAFPPNLRTEDGQIVNAVYGFARLLMDVLIKFKPSHVVALADAPGPTVRTEQYHAYKANRGEIDQDLVSQFPLVYELLTKFNIPLLKISGFEADDLIGTIDAKHSGNWAKTVIVTGDRDLFQLVDEDTFVYMAGGSFAQSRLYDSAGVEEKMGIKPEYITDLKALHGDPSDNIPGVAGIGEKGAVALITQYGHIEQMYEQIDAILPKYQQKLINSHEMAVLSKQLATIIKDVPISFDFEKEAIFGDFDQAELRQFFVDMRFSSINSLLSKVIEQVGAATAAVGDDAGLIGLGVDLPEVTIREWQPEQKMAQTEELYIYASVDTTGDPLHWQLQSLLISDGDQVFSVADSDIDAFVSEFGAAKLICTNAKHLLHALMNKEVDCTGLVVYDLIISTYLLSYGQTKQDEESLFGWYKLPYAAKTEQKLASFPDIVAAESEKLANIPDVKKLIDLEQRLIPVIVSMERAGIKLDGERLDQDAKKLTEVLSDIEKSIHADVGHEFNVASPKQVGQVLFEEKQLPTKRKTKSGSYTTDERTLRELTALDPVVQKILDYRELSKLLSTYIRPLPKQVNPDTKRVHGVFNQIGAVTGRFSSQNPNLQNIPLGDVAGVNMRDAFVAEKGKVLIAFDYSQQELRLLAELSTEKNMQQAFREGQDIHARTAAEIFEVPLADVTKDQRKVGKTVNFGVVYGISAFGLADRLKIDNRKAAEFISKYFERYPRVRIYYDELLRNAKQNGYVETLMGRRRETFGLNSSNFAIRQATEREVMNFPLQGSAADITKLAMVNVAKFIDEFPVRLILQVHDELMFEYGFGQEDMVDISDIIKKEKVLAFVRKVRETMLSVTKLAVPLEVGVEMGWSWGSMNEIEF